MSDAQHNTKATAAASVKHTSEYPLEFEAEGETLRIVSTLPTVISALRELGYEGTDSRISKDPVLTYRIGSKLDSTGRPGFFVEYDGSIVLDTPEEELVLRYLIIAIRRFIFQDRGADLFVHAGAVSFKDLGILLPGESRSGKSTLTLALLLNGCRCLSDDLAIMEHQTLRLVPTGRNISLRRETHSLFTQLRDQLIARTHQSQQVSDEKVFLPVESVGEDLLSASCTLGLIVFPRFQRGSTFGWQCLERGTAARKLLRLCHNLRWRTKERLDLAIEAVRKVDCFILTFEDVNRAANWIVGEAHSRLQSRVEQCGVDPWHD